MQETSFLKKKNLTGHHPRKYQAELFEPSPSLPSIEDFKLKNILSNQLKEESQEVTDALLKVVSNYQGDLRKGIKHHLANEQKLQSKNIKLAKLATKINKSVSRNKRKLEKFVGPNSNSRSVDDQIRELSISSVEASSKIKLLTRNLSSIERTLISKGVLSSVSEWNDRYPLLSKLLDRSGRETSFSIGATKYNKSRKPQDRVENRNNQTNLQTTNEAKEERKLDVQPDLNGQQVSCSSDHQQSSLSRESTASSEKLSDGTEMNPEAFEEFMSSSINKFRRLKDRKYSNSNIFTNSANDTNSSKDSSKSSYSSKSLVRPLDLLYPSLLAFGSHLDHTFQSNANIKSSPTVKLSNQTSHFKKLRILGLPITSETYGQQKNITSCDCANQKNLEAHVKGPLNGLKELSLSDENEREDSSSPLDIDYDYDYDYDDDDDDDDDDNDDHIDYILESSSSEDSLDNNLNETNAEQFFRAEIELKKRLRKAMRRGRKRTRRDFYRQETSPTPKHQPSHHTLQPKPSILKVKTLLLIKNETVQKGLTRTQNLLKAHFVKDSPNEVAPLFNLTPPLENEVSVSGLTVSGTILGYKVPKDSDLESSSSIDANNELPHDSNNLQSISRLKSYLPNDS